MSSGGFWKGRRKSRQIPGPCLRTEKCLEHEGNVDTNYNWNSYNSPQELEKGTLLTGD